MFSKNRDRLLSTEMSREVMGAILAHRDVAPLLSDDHFSVDGTLVKAWASMKSFRPKTEDGPSDDDLGGSGGPKIPTASPSEPTTSETATMNRQSRNTEVNSEARDAPMPRMHPPPTQTHGFTRNRPAQGQCSFLSAMR